MTKPPLKLNVEFEVGKTLTLRPDQIVRGAVVLTILEVDKAIWASTIKIKFRGEETASAKAKEPGATPGIARTTYFECSHIVWSGGTDQLKANEGFSWKELSPGIYKFGFALKLPAVNFPPSVEGPKGFSIRYIWQSVIERAGGTMIEGPEIVTPFIPVCFAPPDQEWSYRETLYNESKLPKKILIYLEAVVPKHVYSPGEELKFVLCLTNYSAGRITCIQCSLRKHFEGLLDKEFFCDKHERSLVSTKSRCNIAAKLNQQTGEIQFSLTIPKKHHHVPPTFTGRHLRVFYTLRCVIQAEVGRIFPSIQYYEVNIPISIAPFPHISQKEGLNNLYPSHNESRIGPYFFDPCVDFPQDYSDSHISHSLNPIVSMQLNDLYNNDFDSTYTPSPYPSENNSSLLSSNIVENPQRLTVIVNNPNSPFERNEKTTFTTN